MLSKIIFFGCFLVFSASADNLPNWIKPCSKKDTECIKKNIEYIIRDGKSGFSGTFPAIDPVFIERAETPDASGSVALKQKFTDFTYSGISAMLIKDIRASFDNKCQIKMRNFQPKAVLKGDYAADGRLLLFQVKGADKFEVILNNLNASTTINCAFYQKDNVEYLKITSFKFQLRPESGHFSFPNIIQNNEELSKTVNDLLNENFIDIFDEFKSTIQEKLEERFTDISNKMIGEIPTKILFKD